jgi:hypothetical protein
MDRAIEANCDIWGLGIVGSVIHSQIGSAPGDISSCCGFLITGNDNQTREKKENEKNRKQFLPVTPSAGCHPIHTSPPPRKVYAEQTVGYHLRLCPQ